MAPRCAALPAPHPIDCSSTAKYDYSQTEHVEEKSMNANVSATPQVIADPVSNVLKWTLLATAIICFGLMAWATDMTYRTARRARI